MKRLLRIDGGLLGLGVAFMVILMPLLTLANHANEAGWRETHPPSFWGGVADWGFTVFAMAMFSGIAFMFLRYAFTGESHYRFPER